MATAVLKDKKALTSFVNKIDSGEIRNVEEVLSSELFLISALDEHYLVVGSHSYKAAVDSLKNALDTSSIVVDSIIGEKSEISKEDIKTLNQGINPEDAKKYKQKVQDETPSEKDQIKSTEETPKQRDKRKADRQYVADLDKSGMSISEMLSI